MSVLISVGADKRFVVNSDDLLTDKDGQLCILLDEKLVHCYELSRGGKF